MKKKKKENLMRFKSKIEWTDILKVKINLFQFSQLPF